MPLNKELKRVMVIGSGPIVIGQAAEFDYAGTQACRALKEAGLEVILVNSNPATIMTDNIMADKIYIEPLNLETIKRIIEKERPDSLLSSLGGQTGLTLSMQLAKEGFLEKMGVKLLGAKPETIDKAEDRQMFKDTMEAIDQPIIPSKVVTDLESALNFAEEIGYPVIVRPAFTLGGTGGGIAENVEELTEIGTNGLRLSPITQILVEKCISGWKEIEFEVIRDSKGNSITVCSMENFDPVGVHTGDSIVAAPALTLSSKEYGMLREAALKIVNALEVEGGCNCQFALKPDSFDYAVIEVNPRVSRSSALASKATGYPIAKVATKIAIGYTLDEIQNAVTGKTVACFEPTIDYVVVKFPKWPFDKFVYAKRKLGTQMKATGEVMSIGQSFEEALMKAVRGAEIKHMSLNQDNLAELSDDELMTILKDCTDERLFILYEFLKRGKTIEELNEITKIDCFFLNKLLNILNMERKLMEGKLGDELYLAAKRMGFPDKHIENLSGCKIENKRYASFKMVDTCAAEYSAETPYFYSSFDKENEAAEFLANKKDKKKTIIVFGSGPIRIGQGIEFDYASVHCVRSLKKLGYDVVIVNNNPETVSTDFDTADRLYFEPLTDEDVMSILKTEQPYGAVVAFGGQTAIKLTNFLDKNGIRILGTGAESIDAAEDRKIFDALLESLNIKRPVGATVFTEDEALAVAAKIGYPVLMRPSYVLGGQNMIIAQNPDDIKEYMKIIITHTDRNPILIDKYLMGLEIEVDAICDGEDILIPGIMEHVERTGVHSGDSIAIYPAKRISDKMRAEVLDCTKKLAVALNTRGLVNIQYLINDEQLYVIEVNPRSSRTIPYISKVTGIPMVDLATRTMIGKESEPEKTEFLKDMGFGTGIYPDSPYVAVKVPVFSFEKLHGVDSMLGPEMKSTGEVLGIASTIKEAICKGLIAAGYKMTHKKGGVLITVRNSDKQEIVDVAEKFHALGFTIYSSDGTGKVIQNADVPVEIVETAEERLALMDKGEVDYVISTSDHGRIPTRNSVILRRKAIERSIPCLTAIDTAHAVADSLISRYTSVSTELVDINDMRTEKEKLYFTKMQGTGNDYIYFNCFDQKINNPEGLAVMLSNRHFGIGGDGVVLICPSKIADAKMKIYNKDGTRGMTSGNALRCVGKYLYDNGMIDKKSITIETGVGVKSVELEVKQGVVQTATVNMGKANLDPKSLPALIEGDSVIAHPIQIGYKPYRITCVSIGNPHCVVFFGADESLENLDVATIGPMFESDDLFPERVNTEFVKVLNDHTLKMRVWERGNGETMACGTGACAAAVAACLCGYCKKNTDITVKLKGGDLIIRYTDEGVFLSGNADISFTGEVII